MHIVVINNDNFVATHPRTVVQYTLKCTTTIKIYGVRKLITLIYIRRLRNFLFLTLCFILFVSQTFRISKQIFLRDSVGKPKYS